MFTPMTGNQLTVNVTIGDDLIVEDNERVSIFLSSQDPSVDVLTPQKQIVFIDDDSEL